ncbi:hypothetical protein CRYUN_Cryun24cG0088000 [Craigia yunnanensis]
MDRSLTVCAFCNIKTELEDHLFFSCHFSWKIWVHYCFIWGLDCVMHNQPTLVLLAWQSTLQDNQCKEVWKMVFFAIIWSIWLMRNDMIFNGKVSNVRQIIDTISLRIALWFNAKWPDSVNSILDVVKCSNNTMISPKFRVAKKVSLWKVPPLDSLKFNMDGSARGKPSLAGIDGVRRDCTAMIKAVFSKTISMTDSNVVKLLAVRETLRIFTAFK